MNNEIYQRVEKLASSLSPAEKDILSKHTESSLHPWQKKSKLLELLELLMEQTAGEKEGKQGNASFSRKNFEMLENKILETLLFDVNLNRMAKASTLFQLKKEALKVHILHQRGILDRAYQLADQCILQAEKEENYDIIIESLNFQLSMIALHQQHQKFRELNEKINHYEYCRLAKRKSLLAFYELKMKKFYGLQENLDMFVDDSIEVMTRYREKLHCKTIDFILEYFIKERLEIAGSIHEAHYHMSKLFEKARELPPHTPHFNFWELVFEQARLCFKISDYDTGRFLLNKCILNLPEEHIAYQRAVEMNFLLSFFAGRYNYSLKIAAGYLQSRYYRLYLPEYSQALWNYYLACAYFKKGNRKEAGSLLNNKVQAFEKENTENAFLVRFLKIMISIENQQADLTDTHLDALRKFISRHKLLKQIKEMELYNFYRSLCKLRICGYNFEHFTTRYSHHLQKTRKSDISRYGYEHYRNLMFYNEWLQTRISRTKEESLYREICTQQVQYFYETGRLLLPGKKSHLSKAGMLSEHHSLED